MSFGVVYFMWHNHVWLSVMSTANSMLPVSIRIHPTHQLFRRHEMELQHMQLLSFTVRQYIMLRSLHERHTSYI